MQNRLLKMLIGGWLASIFFLAGAQEKYVILDQQGTVFDMQVIAGEITGNARVADFFTEPVYGPENLFLRITLPGAFPSVGTGMPSLPVFSKLVEADSANNYKLVIHDIDSMVIDLEDTFGTGWILPVQPPARKIELSLPDSIFGISAAYLASGQVRAPLVRLRNEGRMRGLSLSRVEIAPFRYDPAEKMLTVYHQLNFSLVPENPPSAGYSLRSPLFRKSMEGVTLDTHRGELKRIVQDEPVTMVILSDTLFRNALQPLVEWKRLKGFRVIEAYTSDTRVGNTAGSIRDYMSDLYHQPPDDLSPPSYLLIVGDVEHVPASRSVTHVTDLYYTTFDGPEDYLPEMFHGRISVKNDTQLTHVIDKILMYEKYEFPDPSFLDRTILIAGYDASYAPVHGNGQINYASGYYFNESMGIEASVFLHPQAATLDAGIRQEISEGAALVNYTGHGEYDGWLDPSFRLTDLDEMTNQYRFGLMIGNGCSTNQFSRSSGDCFAEAILKLEDRGAVGYIGCTNDSYWDEDYYWSVGVGPITANPLYEQTTSGYYDKLFHLGEEPVEEWSPSLGEMIFAGNMSVQESNSARKKYYWEIYQVMGDPSLVPWFTTPANDAVIHPGSIPQDARHVNVKASGYDYVALSAGGELLQAAHADMFGQVYLQIPETILQEELVLVVTGDMRQPYIDTILRVSGGEGYLELVDYQLSEEWNTKDGIVSPGERFSLDISLLNSSDSVAQAGDLTLFCAEDFIEIGEPKTKIGALQPGETVTLEDAFRMTMKGAPADGTSFTIGISRSGLDDGNTLYIREVVHAPALKSVGITWDDRPYGNGNGIPENGETILFSWEILNNGSYRSDSMYVQELLGSDAPFDLYRQISFGVVSPGASATLKLLATIAEGKSGTALTRLPFVSGDHRYTVGDSVTFVVGRHLEDFSTGDLSMFNWINGSARWNADHATYFGGPFSMRSAQISHSQSTSLGIDLNLAQPDTISFRYRISSEAGYDYLKFFVDDVMMDRWSGYTDWELAQFPVDSGQHFIEWRYEKDSNTDRGEDAAWIDDIVFPSGVFTEKDLGVLKPVYPVDSKILGQEESMRVLVINNGKDTIEGFAAGYRFGDGAWLETTFNEALLPSQQLEIDLPVSLDLTGFATYDFAVAIRAEEDMYPGNDTLEWTATHFVFPDIAVHTVGIDSAASAYMRLKLEINNLGNVPFEKLYYHLYLDEDVKRDSVLISLQPGTSGPVSVSLIEAGMDIETGWHDYLFIADADSVPANNSVEGSVFWSVLSEAQERSMRLQVFPNPVHNEFTIRTPRGLSPVWQISFYDLEGRLLFSEDFSGNQKLFKAKEVFDSEGLYLFKLKDPGGKYRFSGNILF